MCRLFTVLTVLVFAAAPAAAAPSAELWPRWLAHDAASTRSLDHAAWDRFLAAYVVSGADGINRVAYGRVGADDRAALAAYIADLAAAPVSRLNRAEQRALWVNLYNALTVKVVLDHYPVQTIRDIDISPGFFKDGPWDRELVTVERAPVTLNDIEHRILRPIWKDARLHYVLNCAALGCPNLPPRAVTAANGEEVLESAARAYVNHERGVAFADERPVVSKIYDWYEDDFGGSEQGVIAHLRRYAEPALARRLAGLARISDTRYDWALNDAR